MSRPPSKRPADAVLENPDAKRQETVTGNRADENPVVPLEPTSTSVVSTVTQNLGSNNIPSMFQNILGRLGTPIPIRDFFILEFPNYDGFDPFFRSIRTSLVSMIYPDCADNLPPPYDFINEIDWSNVCKYYLHSRLHHVYAKVLGRRPSGRVPLQGDTTLPKALADMFNDIGTCQVFAGALTVVPSPSPPPADPTACLSRCVSHAHLKAFHRLVHDARVRNFISVSSLSSCLEGTPWYLLSTKVPSNPAQDADFDMDTVRVFSTFAEFTPADAFRAALVCRGFDGTIDDLSEFYWSMEPIRGLHCLRNQMVSDA